MRHIRSLVALVALGAVGITLSAVAPAASSTLLPDVLPAASGLVDLIERIDRILETVLDLVRTINNLFGGGEAIVA